MNKIVSRGLWFTVILGGLSLAGVGAANAAESSGDNSAAGGDQAAVSLNLPVTVSGNAISVLGDSHSSDSTATTAAADPAPAEAPAAAAPAAAAPDAVPASAPPAAAPTTSGNDSIGGGAQGIVSVSVPVTVSGNAVSVVGNSSSSNSTATTTSSSPAPAAAPSTSGNDSILGGDQALVGVSAPVTVSGNAVSVLGDSSSRNSSATTAVAPAASEQNGAGSASTSGNDSILGGLQALVGVGLPIDVSGNAVSGLGDSWSSGSTATTSTGSGSGSTSDPCGCGGSSNGGSGSMTTSGDDSILGGAQVPIGIVAPVTVAGNAVSVLGDSTSRNATTTVVAANGGAGSGDMTTSGNDSILGGLQLPISLVAPVTVSGNAVSIIGDSTTTGSTTTVIVPANPCPPTTPVTPITPVTPSVPTTPVTWTHPISGTHAASAVSASGSSSGLADTGSDLAGLWGLMALLFAAGLGLLFIARRRMSAKQ